MRIGEIIRRYRKEQNLTQEEVANFLGVTAPAVNKWENGVSTPDITLLAPLARILKTDVDTLVSFREEITDEEINRIVESITAEVTEKGYVHAFETSKAMVKEYPNCNKLMFSLAQIMNFYLPIQELEESEKYEKQINSWFEAVALCSEQDAANPALIMLCQKAITDGTYEEAQNLLDKVPPLGIDKRFPQANLYLAQGELKKAYEICESMVYQNANHLVMNLTQLSQMKCGERQFEDAMYFAELSKMTAKQFHLGKYIESNAEFAVAVEMKDKKKTVQLLTQMLSGMQEDRTETFRLYAHMKFQTENPVERVKPMLKAAFERDESLDFIRKEPEFIKLMERL